MFDEHALAGITAQCGRLVGQRRRLQSDDVLRAEHRAHDITGQLVAVTVGDAQVCALPVCLGLDIPSVEVAVVVRDGGERGLGERDFAVRNVSRLVFGRGS
ncbi:hypothetical protein [Actinosynnema sp. NPDC023587]|uniref:hypothetical protein n=1 Tax=Actinosynnema sp. NPDC023587 TaxID=3154695 RepID=UPI0033CB4113